MVYNREAISQGQTLEVQLLKDGAYLDSQEVTYSSSWHSFPLTTLYDIGENHFTLVCGSVSRDIDFVVTESSSRNLELSQKSNLKMYFDAAGRSNNQILSKRQKWFASVGNYEAKLNNFNWYNNGWFDDGSNNGIAQGSYLSFTNGASAQIDIPEDLTVNYDSTGGMQGSWTFEIRFRVRNAKKFTTLVTEVPLYIWKKPNGEKCAAGDEKTEEEIEAMGPGYSIAEDEYGNKAMNEENPTKKIIRTDKYIAMKWLTVNETSLGNSIGKGFAIGTQEAYFSVGTKTINVKYKENEIVNLAFVIDGQKRLYIYLNGVLSGAIKLNGTDRFTMEHVPITINSEYCDFDLYNIRIYPKVLTMPQIIQNYLSDNKNVDLYDENQLAGKDETTSVRLSYQKLVEYNELHREKPTMPYAVIDMTGETSTGNTDLPHRKTGQGIDGTNIEFTNPTGDYQIEQGEISPWIYYTKCPSYKAVGANINVQGTSSQIYPRRNFKTKFKNANWTYTAGPLAGLPINYSYYFNEDGSVNPQVINECVDIQREIDRLTAEDKNGNKNAIKAKKNELKQIGIDHPEYKELTKNWHEDSEPFGSNKFTWKIDYMESSGSYNTGFANLVASMYNKHPLDDLGFQGLSAGYRTSVYGFPMMVFHKTAENTYTYIGRYNYNLDKGANERYGFELEKEHPYVTNLDGTHPLVADIAECWELRDNQGSWCSFKYPEGARETGFNTRMFGEPNKIEVAKHFEARYHKDADPFEWGQNELIGKENFENYENVVGKDHEAISNYLLPRLRNLERLFNWLDSTDKNNATNAELPESITYRISEKVSPEEEENQKVTYTQEILEDGTKINYGTFTHDTSEYRRQKFYNEFDKHLDLEYCAVYFVMTELLLCYDSRGKNMMISTFGPQEEGGEYIWYPMFYDIDTQLGLNNVGAKLWDYNEDCTENQTFSTPRSVLWENFYDLFKGTIIAKYRSLREAKLSEERIDGAYSCNPEIFNSIAMEGRRPLIAIGLDIYYKYVLPTYEKWKDQEGHMITADYLYACQGDRKLSRELLVQNRLLYMDSKWLGGTFTIGSGGMAGIMLRSTGNHETSTSDKYIDLENSEGHTPGEEVVINNHTYIYSPYKTNKLDATPEYKITPYLNFYITTFVDENIFQNSEAYSEEKYPNGQNTVVSPSIEHGYKYEHVDQQLNYFAGSSYISSLGDLSTKYLNQIKFPNTPRLLDITLGSDYPGYLNKENINPFQLYTSKEVEDTDLDDLVGELGVNSTAKPLLEKIILTNLTNLSDDINLDNTPKLREFRALGTQIPYVIFTPGAPLDTVHLPKTVQKLEFIQNKNLRKILTTAPIVGEVDGETGDFVYRDPSEYAGLFVDGLTNATEESYGESSPINLIKFNGINMGYDSYTLLETLVKQKNGSGRTNRLQIEMTDVNWTPYVRVESGEEREYGEDAPTYYLLTDHNTYEEYPSNRDWASDSLNGLIYKYDENSPKERITDLSLLQLFLDDYKDTSTTKNQFINTDVSSDNQKTIPILTGELYVYNTEDNPIDEAELAHVDIENEQEKTFGSAWKNLNIRARYIKKGYIIKYMQRNFDTGQDTEIEVFRYSKSEDPNVTQHPEYTEKPVNKQNFDFVGWVTDPSKVQLTRNELSQVDIWTREQIEQLVFSEENDSYIFYAAYVPTEYTFYFLNSDDTVLITEKIQVNHFLENPEIIPMSPLEETLRDDERYTFIGWVENKSDCYPEDIALIELVDPTKIVSRIQITNKQFYACYMKENCLDNITDLKYFNFTTISFDGKNGCEISLKPEYKNLSGKITLPTYSPSSDIAEIDNKPIISIGGFGVINDNAGNNNSIASKITHVYFKGEPNLLLINTKCFYNCIYLQVFDIPETVKRIGIQAFQSCQNLKGINLSKCRNLDYVGGSAFNNAFSDEVPINIYIPSSVTTLGEYAFGYFSGYQGQPTLQIGEPGNPSQWERIEGNDRQTFRQNSWRLYSKVTIYYTPSNILIKQNSSFFELFGLAPGVEIEFIDTTQQS